MLTERGRRAFVVVPCRRELKICTTLQLPRAIKVSATRYLAEGCRRTHTAPPDCFVQSPGHERLGSRFVGWPERASRFASPQDPLRRRPARKAQAGAVGALSARAELRGGQFRSGA